MKLSLTLFFIFSIFYSFSQEDTDTQLAQYYYANGEFNKASSYYEKLYEKDPSKVNFDRYYDCLLKIEDFKEAEKLLKNESRSSKNDINFKLREANFYHLSGNQKKIRKIIRGYYK